MSVKMSKTDDETLFYCQNTNSVNCYFQNWVYSIQKPVPIENQLDIEQHLTDFGCEIAKFRFASNVKKRSDFSKLNFIFLSTIMLIESLSNSNPQELVELQKKFIEIFPMRSMKDITNVSTRSGRSESLIMKRVISPYHIRCIFLGFMNNIQQSERTKKRSKMKVHENWIKLSFNKNINLLQMLNVGATLVQLFDPSLSNVHIKYINSEIGYGCFSRKILPFDENTPISISLVLPLNVGKTNIKNSNNAILPVNYYYNSVNFNSSTSSPKEKPNALSHIFDVYSGIIGTPQQRVKINAIYVNKNSKRQICLNEEIKWDYENKLSLVTSTSKRIKLN